MKIGLIGAGLMGTPMGKRILSAGFSLTAYNRTAAKLADLETAGAAIAPNPQAVFEQTDCTLLMLSDKNAIQQVVLADENLPSLAGHTIIQMGTIAPAESQAIHGAIAEAGGDYLEAPVLGSIPEAEAGTLIIMAGCRPEQFQQWQPVLSAMGRNPLHVGEVGTAAALKLAMNQLIGSLTAAFSLSLGLVQRYGVDLETFMTVVRQSALYAPTFDKKLSRMVERNFANPNFPTKHLLKDTKLAIASAESVHLNTAVLQGLRQILETAIQQNLADTDYSALYDIINPLDGE
jgi:3-hydroxyisobutyrate dehydrogenase